MLATDTLTQGDVGSNPTSDICICGSTAAKSGFLRRFDSVLLHATEAQLEVQATSNRQVVGSNPTRGFTPAGCNVM